MDVSGIPLFALADRRLAWIDARQSVLARDIANVDTPGWRGRDLKPFAAALGKLAMTQTDPGHITTSSISPLAASVNRGESGPDGNGVAMDQELVKVADTDAAHELVTNVTKKYLGMFRTVIGH